jgi:hypothetical protein
MRVADKGIDVLRLSSRTCASSKPTTRGGGTRPKQILLIDDDAAIQDVFRSFPRLTYKVVAAATVG